jgi:diguanylate cyclase (GGDEF)-like protein/PAS domain S-box-containing protein
MQGQPGLSMAVRAADEVAPRADVHALVVAHAPMGIAAIDADGIYRSVNPAYCALYGWRAEELLGQPFTAIVPSERQAQAMARHRDFLASGASMDGDFEVRHRDGRRFDMQMRSVAVTGLDGRPMRVAYVMDITERQQAARVLQAQQQSLQVALDALRDGDALLRDMAASIPGAMFRLQQEPGRPWRFTYVSLGIQALFGLTPEQVCADVRTLRQCVVREERAQHDAVIRAAVQAGCAFEQEYRIHSTDGTPKWVHARAVPKREGAAGAALTWTGMLQDVSERKHMEVVLRSSEERYRRLFETVPQGVVYQDAQGRITSANPAAQRILGRTLAQMQGQHDDDPGWQVQCEDGSPLPADQHPAAVALRTGAPVADVVLGVPVPGRGLAWLLVSATPLKRHGVVEEVYASFEDITERVLLSRELKLQASTDFLTGVANRRSLMQCLAVEFERVRRSAGSHRCAVLAIDLDLFKQVNDRHGHAAGDAVLQQVAALMRRITRQHDLVARSGGEEFMLLLPEAGADDALALAERLRAGLRTQPVQHQGLQLAVTVSVGVSPILPEDTSVDAVLARADGALYAAKAAGRDRVCLAPLPG